MAQRLIAFIVLALVIGELGLWRANAHAQSQLAELVSGYTASTATNVGPDYGPTKAAMAFRSTGEAISGGMPAEVHRAPAYLFETLEDVNGTFLPVGWPLAIAANGHVAIGHLAAAPFTYVPTNGVEADLWDSGFYIGPTTEGVSPACPAQSLCVQRLFINGVEVH